MKALWVLAALVVVACSAGAPATPPGLIPNVERRSPDAVTWCSAEHRSDTKGNEDTQATASDLGAGLDQQEVRRSATSSLVDCLRIMARTSATSSPTAATGSPSRA